MDPTSQNRKQSHSQSQNLKHVLTSENHKGIVTES